MYQQALRKREIYHKDMYILINPNPNVEQI